VEQSKMDTVQVSVVCLTYNHEKYLRKALEGIVSQKTDFAFEVIVHEDASTDRTAEILKEYAEKYRFIRPIFQTVNQYSQGKDIESEFCYSMVEGRYVAFCEGDDYWTDENKLQTMYDYLSTHPSCTMCCHAYLNVEANTEKKIAEVHCLRQDGKLEGEKIILFSNPPQLASTMFPREILENQPDCFLHRGVGDYTAFLYAAAMGDVYYMDKIMACHRIMSDGSWSMRMRRDSAKRIAHFQTMIAFLEEYDSFSEQKYHCAVYKRKKGLAKTIQSIRRSDKRGIIKRSLKYLMLNSVIAHIPSWTIRRSCYRRLGMSIGKGSRIQMKCIVNTPQKITVGENTVINEGCVLDGRGGLIIGDNTSISMQSMIITASHDMKSNDFAYYEAPVTIGDHVWLGVRAMVLDGSRVENGCVVGAGAVLKGTTEENCIYLGIPAKKAADRNLNATYTIDYTDYFK